MLLCLIAVLCAALPVPAGDLPVVKEVEGQPLAAQCRRLAEALDHLGTPLPQAERQALDQAIKQQNAGQIQAVLDKHCLFGVQVRENRTETLAGSAKPLLMEQGWRVFVVKVLNPAGVKGLALRPDSPNARPMHVRSTSSPAPKVESVGDVKERFLDLAMFDRQPLLPTLSGLEVEYVLLQVFSRDPGRREASIGFTLQGRGANQPRVSDKRPAEKREPVVTGNRVNVLFTCEPAVVVKFRVRDFDGQPSIGAFTIRDRDGRVYPAQSRRLAPDFFFHSQVYRRDGESVVLPPGKYRVTYTRGPEYLVLNREITVPDAASHTEEFDLKRWVHPLKKGWYSGDHHIHAAGCAHYESPTEGVTPEDMMRHVLGEDLNLGICLSWGPCWYHQKRYFDAKTERHSSFPVHALSTPTHQLRYDVEVSGFPSSHCGHICLLRLKNQDYPGTKLIEDWPSWDLPIFKWAKGQGGVVGFAHSGWGLEPENNDVAIRQLPNYIPPKMNNIGANEYLVDIVHDACDFISTVDTPAVYELNIWYHTLNCGYRCRISGETDFPCIYGERVGLGRSYVHLPGQLKFEDWAEGIKQGRCYVSDGRSHLMDFEVNNLGVGLHGSEVKLSAPAKLKLTAKVAALLEPKPTPETERIRNTPLNQKPYWDVERARIGATRKVPVEVVVNGQAVAKKEIEADGSEQAVEFDVAIDASSWVALRIFPSSHTNPVFVMVGDKPIRASKRSAEWCLKGIENCWREKSPRIRESERAAAKEAYDLARQAYEKIRDESVKD
jgi:hypothetical protein